MKRSILLLLVLCFVLFTSHTLLAAGTLNIGLGADASLIDPRFSTSAYDSYIGNQIFNGLIRLDKNLQFEGDLAKNWENPTPTTYVFELREGVLFHDGTELTAYDVKYTFESVLNPEYGSPRSGSYMHVVGAREFNEGEADEVAGIQVIDDYTISFEVQEPFAPFLMDMTMGIVPQHIAEGEGQNFNNILIGTGPFVFEDRIIEQETVLVAFDDYHEGRPHVDTIVFKVIPDETVRVLELETGAIDVLMGVPADAEMVIEDNPELVLASAPGTNYQYIGFNVTRDVVEDRKVRQAIAYALDKDEITDFFDGDRTYVPLPGGHYLADRFAQSDKIHKYEHNIDRAKELLAEAGYPDGVTVTIKTSAGRSELAQIMREMLMEAGINAEIDLLEWGTFFSDVVEARVQIYLLGWYGVIDPDGYRFFHSGMTPPDGGANRMYYENPEVDALIEKARTTVDIEEREDLTEEIYSILTYDLPMIFLYSLPDRAAYRKGLVGFEPAPFPITILRELKNVQFE